MPQAMPEVSLQTQAMLIALTLEQDRSAPCIGQFQFERQASLVRAQSLRKQ